MEYSRRQLNNIKANLFEQGYLDDQFHQIEELQDDASPNFLQEVVTLFFRDTTRLIDTTEQALKKSPQDFRRLDSIMHQFKGSSSSIGALRVKNECSIFRDHCNQGNIEGCLKSFQKVKKELAILRQKLEAYFKLLNQSESVAVKKADR
ncbi:Histidine-containing phosphotransfer protein 4 [Zostera marina]|uniref:Histidine-containing phosphotransfer protein n=1 Tax=Zostera marina TaxID=29655 RepID=A0A0K9PJG0_ZOSMR|nr:Histidine-containing phosphotransfer protein 4 [Zostera marina]